MLLVWIGVMPEGETMTLDEFYSNSSAKVAEPVANGDAVRQSAQPQEPKSTNDGVIPPAVEDVAKKTDLDVSAADKGADVAPKKAEDEEESEDSHTPDNLDGYQKALAAARGDKRVARKKWKEAEQRLRQVETEIATYRGQLAVYEQQRQALAAKQQQPVQPIVASPVAVPDLTDNDLYTKGAEPVKAYIEHRISAIKDENEKIRQSNTAKINQLSVALAKTRHPDYEEKVAITRGVLAPNAAEQILSSADPAETLYQYAINMERFRGVSNIEEYNAKIIAEREAELRQKIETELVAKYHTGSQQSAPKPPKPLIPPSLADARGSGVGKPAVWSGPRSLSELYPP